MKYTYQEWYYQLMLHLQRKFHSVYLRDLQKGLSRDKFQLTPKPYETIPVINLIKYAFIHDIFPHITDIN